jgi:hypothetical protein
MYDPVPEREPWRPPDGARPHPAKFSPEVLDALVQIVDAECERQQRRLTVLDSFGGVGLVHDLADRLPERMLHVLAVELEPEWATQRPGVIVGDACDLVAAGVADSSVDVLATSPCYGNRMADAYMGDGPCKLCRGSGAAASAADVERKLTCPRCDGHGVDRSARMTYAISLGRKPSAGSAAVLQWGDRYRELHSRAWAAADAALRPGALAVVNISNHVRGGEVQRVVEWHLDWWLHHRYTVETVDKVGTRRYGFGSNRDARVDAERVLVLRKPS